MTKKEPTVYFLHAIDTEGPLYESLDASFERIDEIIGIKNIEKSYFNFKKLQKGEIDLNGKEKAVMEIINDHRVNYMDTWNKLDNMLDKCLSDKFRNDFKDSFGNGWIYNWFCLDHVGFSVNPRRRTMGYHAIHDHYLNVINEKNNSKDQIQWHFHPMSTYKEAHRCATSYVNSPHLYETLARRIIERNFFPSVFRAGFQAERPDSNLFLEQWIPFDISNTSIDDKSGENSLALDLKNGRSCDWRRATTSWTPYHPHHDNYQLEGNCRRWIGRALNLKNRFANFNFYELEKAFKQAKDGLPTLVGLASHDFRDLSIEIEEVREMLKRIIKKYPEVKYKYCNATEAFRDSLNLNLEQSLSVKLDMKLNLNPKHDFPNLEIRTINGKVFGPQPFLAIETRNKSFYHDNLDFHSEDGTWFYAFHPDTIEIDDVKKIGIAANDKYGRSFIKIIEL